MKIAYVNGSYVNEAEATIPANDRGTDFADGVYEVVAYKNRTFIDFEPHLTRLERSMEGLRITPPMGMNALKAEIESLVAKNDIEDGLLYLRITRGACDRNHPFPSADVCASLFMSVKPWKRPSEAEYKNGVSVITVEEIRWKWRHIKSISLLPNILAKQAAVEANAREAWFVDEDGTVTEASSSNVYIVKDKTIITHPADKNILGGITRATLLDKAKKSGIKVLERKFTIDEALNADEAFMSSTSVGAIPVIEIDGKKIGTGPNKGKPGEITTKLYDLYEEHINQTTKTHGHSI